MQYITWPLKPSVLEGKWTCFTGEETGWERLKWPTQGHTAVALDLQLHKQPCGWLMDAVPTGGLFILLSGFVWLSRVLHLQIPDTCLAPSNRVPGPGRRGPWQWSRPCAPPLPLLLPFCSFSDDHFSQGEGGEYEKAWNCISTFYYLGATEAGEQARSQSLMMVFSALELSCHGGIQTAGTPLNQGETRGSLIHPVVVTGWWGCKKVFQIDNCPVRGDKGYTDPSSEQISQRFKLHCLESCF